MFNNMMSLKEPMCSIKPELLSIQLHWFVVFYLYIKKCVSDEFGENFSFRICHCTNKYQRVNP